MTKLIPKIALLFLSAIMINFETFSQESESFNRLSAGLSLGVPYTLFGVKSQPMGIYTGNIRYALNQSFSIESKFTSNVFYNYNTGNPFNPNNPIPPGHYAANQILNYQTMMRGIHLIGYYNLTNAFGLDKNSTNNWAPFLNFGGGIHWYKFSSTLTDGRLSRMNTYSNIPARDYQLGIGTRYYINHNLDLNFGAEFHYVESYYIDAASADKKLDNFLNFHIGAQYKIGAKPWNNSPEWKFKDIDYPGETEGDYTKWSADANVGIPYMFSPVGYRFTGMFGAGLRHSFSKSFSMGFYYNYGSLGAEQSVSNLPPGSPLKFIPSEVKSVTSSVNQFTLRGFLNILNLRNTPETRPDWNHYLVFGYGFTSANVDIDYANGTSNTYKLGSSNNTLIRTPVVGYQIRRYINRNFDWSMGLDYVRNESRWLDGAYNKKESNPNLYFYTGITVKFGNGGDGMRENIDWSFKSYSGNKKEKQVPIKEVPVAKEEPSRAVELPTEPIKEETKEVPAVVDPVVPSNEKIAVEPVPSQPPVEEKKVEPKSKPRPIIVDQSKAMPNQGDEVTEPPMLYNVIVACYSTNNLNSAIKFKRSLEAKGYQPSLYRSRPESRIIRVSILSTNDKREAFTEWRKARNEIEPASWIHLYNKQ